jgi:periplasmic protein TonB
MGQEDKQVVRGVGMAVVLLVHIGVLYSLWTLKLISAPDEMATLLVNFVAPPVPVKSELPKSIPQPLKHTVVEKPKPQQIVAETPAIQPTEYAAPAPKLAPLIEAPAIPLPAGPVAMTSELSVACPQRDAPKYPDISRRMGEAGLVVLAVELNEQGLVASAKIHRSSGFPRLDEAGLAAVRSWRCTPAQHNGQAVRATALQPFKFVLEGI